MNILLAVTGSVAGIRSPGLAASLSTLGTVRAAFTPAAVHFLMRSEEPWPAGIEKLYDADEWRIWNAIGDPVLHIELRKWADVLVVAPATADFIAKVVNGIADNFVLSICRAWDFTKPFLIAPAMNTMMWDHPITYRQIMTLQGWGVHLVEPVSKELACGDVGLGGMADIDVVTGAVRSAMTPTR